MMSTGGRGGVDTRQFLVTNTENVNRIHTGLNTDRNVGEHSAAGEIEESRLSAEDVVRGVVSPEQERRELQTDGHKRTQ